jgi:sigma-E factor negative regulatory protein RseC
VAQEEGVVIKQETADGTAWVKTVRSGACESCSARASCRTGSDSNEMEVEAFNMVAARIGDRVLISIETKSLLKAAFLLYVFPIICMLAGAVVGQHIANGYGYNPSAVSAGCGFGFFTLAFLLIKWQGGKLSGQKEYKPKIIRILKSAPDTP